MNYPREGMAPLPKGTYLGASSEEHLKGAHPYLQRLYRFVGKFWDYAIVDVVRTLAEQRKNVERGVSQTMESKHLPQEDGYSWAVDAVPYPIKWNEIQRGFDAVKRVDPNLEVLRAYHLAGFINGAGAAMGLDLRQGIDWDSDENFREHSFLDVPHTELRSTDLGPVI